MFTNRFIPKKSDFLFFNILNLFIWAIIMIVLPAKEKPKQRKKRGLSENLKMFG